MCLCWGPGVAPPATTTGGGPIAGSWGLYQASQLPIVLGSPYPPPPALPHGLGSLAFWGPEVVRGGGSPAALTGAVSTSSAAPPLYFPNLSPDSAKCRNFSPSGWQPLLVAAWGGLVAVRGAERRRGSGLASGFPSSLRTLFPAQAPSRS